MALEIAPGLKGIEENLEPTSETVGTVRSRRPSIYSHDLGTAVALARESGLMAEVLGPDLLEILIQQSEREIEFIGNQVRPLKSSGTWKISDENSPGYRFSIRYY
ncbi:MAG: hypothetical protein Ct9H300mP14_17150 [Gammaproteobacteria bacterium]|nr:MAG: hypothetical protein Ct9H300mP14_17150 [Gammaproteobacteria bacterium]